MSGMEAGSSRGRGYMYTQSRFTLLYGTSKYNIVKQLYASKKIKIKTYILICIYFTEGLNWSGQF